MKISRMSFDGTLLGRGYWIYAIIIYYKSNEMYLYIGRTGDNSSANAGSPFQRVMDHFNLRQSVPMNTIKDLIKKNEHEFSNIYFRLLAVGPLSPEQKDYESHKPIRNKMTALEKYVADYFVSKGYNVIGKHDDNEAKDQELNAKVIEALEPQIEKELEYLKYSVNPC